MPSSSSVLITGASKGLGLSIAKAMTDRGDSVVGFSRSESSLDLPNYTHIQGDVTDEQAVKGLFKTLREKKINVDRVVHSAGLAQNSLALVTASEEARHIMDVNFLGTFLVSKHATRAMMRRRFGRIVVLSSINVPLHSRGGSIYNSSKAACESLMRTLTSEAGAMDITYNALGLSIVADTGMADGLTEEAAQEKRVHLDKTGDLSVHEVVNALDFLLGELAAKISGQTIIFGAP